jgi:hypothetical protein
MAPSSLPGSVDGRARGGNGGGLRYEVSGRTVARPGDPRGSGRPVAALALDPSYASLVPAPSRAATRALFAALTLAVAALAGCSASGGSSFDPAAPCTADAQRPGAYPELEAELPATFEGEPPVRRDSGRNCSDAALGTLASHGIEELRFAGALWETGRRSGVTLAVFSARGLTAERLAEFYEAGARDARKTQNVTTGMLRVKGVTGHRLDTLNDESYQSILAFESGREGLVRAVLVASDVREVGTMDEHEDVVRRAAKAALAE